MPIHVSASALKDYVKCSQLVYYRIYEPELKIENREMVIGSIVHKAIEKAWDNKEKALAMGQALCEKASVDPVGRNSVEHLIHTYFESFSVLTTNDDIIEKYFKVKLYDDVYLVGKFDRISRGMVIDWKTDTSPPKRIDNSIQFIIYEKAYNLLYNKEPEGLYLAALKDGSLVRYKESMWHKRILFEQIIPQFISTVRNKSFIKSGLFNGACYRCPYKTQCLDGGERELVYSTTFEE